MKDSTQITSNTCQVTEVFDVEGLTSHGGANLLVDFSRNNLQLYQRLQSIPIYKEAWANSSVAQDLEYLITAYSLGIERIFHLDDIENDPLLKLKLDQTRLPHYTTVYRTLERFDSYEKVSTLGSVNQHILERILGENVILDIDTTVETVHGKLEGSTVAYNPRYHGRASYQPMMAFDGISGALIHVALRSGNSPNAKEKINFYREAKSQLPVGSTIQYVRGDRAYPSDEFCKELEEDGVGYVLKLRMSEEIYQRINRGILWERLPSDPTENIEVGIVGFGHKSWDKNRRVVLIRKQPAQDPQFRLFPSYAWEYQAIVTNLDWSGEEIWHFYNQRANAENYIKELKYGLRIDYFSKAGFWPNAADLWIKAIAYNQILALKGLTDETYKHYSVRRFRRALLSVPGILVKHARQWKLRLPSYWHHKAVWDCLRTSLQAG